jgi:uncharacterized membrane protein YfcA
VIPGSVLGAVATGLLPRGTFDVTFGLVLVAGAAFLFFRPGGELGDLRDENASCRTATGAGSSQAYSFDAKVGCGVSFLEGFLSSMLGIGGGIIQVPLLVRLLHFPPHIATATSQFIVAVMAFAATVVHIVSGDLGVGGMLSQVAPLAIGVAVGAQAGARLSRRIHGRALTRFLSLGLGFVGLHLLLGHLLRG